MPFNGSGVYTPPNGAENAVPGGLIQSSVWNSIFTDISTALTTVGERLLGTSFIVTSSAVAALAVGPNGATNPALQVDASVASLVAGLKIAGAVTGGTVALSVIDSGSNTNMSIDAKGAGVVSIGTGSSAGVVLKNITYGGVTLSNSVTGTGSMVLSANASLTGTTSISSMTTPNQIVSTLATGTAPLLVASTTNVANLNASLLNGANFGSPGAIGGTIPGAGTFTALTASGLLNISGAGAGQIQFPATQNLSANANTLDDYEEGTFTPTLTFGGASVGMTFSTRTGSYTKIGNMVCFVIEFILSAKGSSTGTAQIASLPATANSFNPPISAQANNMSAGTTTTVQAIVNGGTTTIQLQAFAAGTATALADTNFTATTVLRVAGMYFTA